jgi:hypothetical protein
MTAQCPILCPPHGLKKQFMLRIIVRVLVQRHIKIIGSISRLVPGSTEPRNPRDPPMGGGQSAGPVHVLGPAQSCPRAQLGPRPGQATSRHCLVQSQAGSDPFPGKGQSHPWPGPVVGYTTVLVSWAQPHHRPGPVLCQAHRASQQEEKLTSKQKQEQQQQQQERQLLIGQQQK